MRRDRAAVEVWFYLPSAMAAAAVLGLFTFGNDRREARGLAAGYRPDVNLVTGDVEGCICVSSRLEMKTNMSFTHVDSNPRTVKIQLRCLVGILRTSLAKNWPQFTLNVV